MTSMLLFVEEPEVAGLGRQLNGFAAAVVTLEVTPHDLDLEAIRETKSPPSRLAAGGIEVDGKSLRTAP